MVESLKWKPAIISNFYGWISNIPWFLGIISQMVLVKPHQFSVTFFKYSKTSQMAMFEFPNIFWSNLYWLNWELVLKYKHLNLVNNSGRISQMVLVEFSIMFWSNFSNVYIWILQTVMVEFLKWQQTSFSSIFGHFS